MSKSPVVLLGMVCAGTWGGGVRAETGQQLRAPPGPADHAATPQAAAASMEQNGPPRPRVTAGFVPPERLRQSPLPRPSGHLHLLFPGLRDEVEVNLFNEDGSYDTDAIAQASHLLRCRRTDAEKPIAPRLLMLLSHVEDHFGGKPIEIVSGYRPMGRRLAARVERRREAPAARLEQEEAAGRRAAPGRARSLDLLGQDRARPIPEPPLVCRVTWS